MDGSALLYGAGGTVLFVAILFAGKFLKAWYEEYFYNANDEITHFESECIKYQNEERAYKSLIDLVQSSANQYQYASIAHYIIGFSITIILSIALMHTKLTEQSANYLFAAVIPMSYIFMMAFHWSVKSDCFHKVLQKEASRLRQQDTASTQGK